VGGGEAGVIFGEMDDDVLAGDVGGGDDGELVPGDVGGEVDGLDAAAGDGGADGGPEPHVGEGEIVDVFGTTENFGSALFADGGRAYGLDVVSHGYVRFRDFDIPTRIVRNGRGVIG
jgi:hypothetical protein